MKVYIVLNKYYGWKVVEDNNHVDTSKPMATFKTLEEAEEYCKENMLEVIRVCK